MKRPSMPLSIETLSLAAEPMDPFPATRRHRPWSPTDCWTESEINSVKGASKFRSVSPSVGDAQTRRIKDILKHFLNLKMRNDAQTIGSLRSISSDLGARVHFRLLWSNIFGTMTTKEFGKLLFVTSLPLLIVVLLCAQSLIRVRGQISAIEQLHQSISRGQTMAKLSDALRKEHELLHDSDLSTARLYTDGVLTEVISKGLPIAIENFQQELEELRNYKDSESQDWYMLREAELNAESSVPFVASGRDGSFWGTVYAYHALLKAKDAIGEIYFDCDTNIYNGTAEALMLKASWILQPMTRDQFMDIMASEPWTTSSAYEHLDTVFMNQTQAYHKAGEWAMFDYFMSLTSYIGLVTSAEDMLTNVMLKSASQESHARTFEFGLTLSLTAASLIICPTLAFWYVFSSRRLLLRIRSYAEELGDQKRSIVSERMKADFLLCQMLPPEIALDVKNSKPVVPEAYEEATVYFSEVDNFAEIVDHLRPFKIVDLLNQLYLKLDFVLGQYNAYKVETSGGIYMVVSGVPIHNEHSHSAVICSLALHVQMVMDRDFTPPDGTVGRLDLRIGIHTGHVVAGIVGLRNKRYCLFGDTVNVASRLMSSGIARKIHISAATTDHLHKYHKDQFATQLRGIVAIRGRGPLTSYWLTGKKDFPFAIDKEHCT